MFGLELFVLREGLLAFARELASPIFSSRRKELSRACANTAKMKARAAQLQGVHATLSDLSSTALVEADLCGAYAEAVDHLREAFVAARAALDELREAHRRPEAAPLTSAPRREPARARGRRARRRAAAERATLQPLHFAAAAAASAAAAAAARAPVAAPAADDCDARPACSRPRA